ncbi:MAG: hypothetical protein ACW99R_13380 [Candidatus Hodarchaeales archaeon]
MADLKETFRPEERKIALVRLGLSFLFVTLCVLLPLMRLAHFFEWELVDIHTDFIRVYELTAKCYFDGYSLLITDRQEFTSELVFMSFSRSTHLIEIALDWEIIAMVGRGIIFLGIFVIYANIVSFIQIWRFHSTTGPRLVLWSSILAIISIFSYWILLFLGLSRVTPANGILNREITIIQTPSPNLIFLFLTMIGIASLIISIKIESLIKLLKKRKKK